MDIHFYFTLGNTLFLILKQIRLARLKLYYMV